MCAPTGTLSTEFLLLVLPWLHPLCAEVCPVTLTHCVLKCVREPTYLASRMFMTKENYDLCLVTSLVVHLNHALLERVHIYLCNCCISLGC